MLLRNALLVSTLLLLPSLVHTSDQDKRDQWLLQFQARAKAEVDQIKVREDYQKSLRDREAQTRRNGEAAAAQVNSIIDSALQSTNTDFNQQPPNGTA